MAKRLIPTLNRVLIEKIVPPSKTTAGILLPESSTKLNSGKVVAVGPGTKYKAGNAIPVAIKEFRPQSQFQRREMSTYMSRLFPRSNSSFQLDSGNALQSQVVRLREDKFVVDAGPGTPRICMQDELAGVPINGAVRFDNMVGSQQDAVAGESLIKGQNLERFFIDVVAGDSKSKERAAARFNSSVGSTDVVAGEPHLLLPRRFRQRLAWMELKKIWRTNRKVKGFVLKKVRGGFLVGIGGFITFLPFLRNKRISNGRFTIESINLKRMRIVLF